MLESNNLLPKWVAIGVAMSVLGAIIQMVAICWFEARFEDSEARKNLKQRVKEWLETENRSAAVKKTLDVRECELILGAHPDSIFAWIHYSDPRKELIDWGRRKLHYVYQAENWMVSIVLGGGAGLGLGVVNMCFFPHEQVPAPWFSISFLGNLVGALGYISLVVIVLIGLQSLRKKNKQYDEDMITMYCSGRICHDLEERFPADEH